MNLYDYIYYRVFKSLSKTNKYIPEWSTILTISVIEFVNILSLLLTLNFQFKSINRYEFLILPILVFLLNNVYFNQKKREKIEKKFRHKKYYIIHDVIILLYGCLSVFILFYLLGYYLYSITIILFAILSFILSRVRF